MTDHPTGPAPASGQPDRDDDVPVREALDRGADDAAGGDPSAEPPDDARVEAADAPADRRAEDHASPSTGRHDALEAGATAGATGAPGTDDAGEAAGASPATEPAPGEVAAAAEAVPDWEAVAAADPRSRGELLAELAAAVAGRDDYLHALQRKQAEFENFRKRMQREATRQRVAGHADVAARVLEVLDDFDRTLASIASSADDGVVTGVRLVRDKLMRALAEVGLERVDDQGAPFDPNRHEAVQQVPGDGEPVVAEVLRPGYTLGDRVLRAAMVAVAQ